MAQVLLHCPASADVLAFTYSDARRSNGLCRDDVHRFCDGQRDQHDCHAERDSRTAACRVDIHVDVSLKRSGGGAQITFVADQTLAVGNYTVPLNGTVGPATASTSLGLNVQTGTPPVFFFTDPNAYPPILSEVAVPLGGSGQISINSQANDELPVDYAVQLSLNGLPAGTTATISPQVITPGQTVTVTITANGNAPTTQSAMVTLVGTPSAPVPSASVSFLADVSPKPGSLPANRTDYLSTEGSPSSAVYDPVHNLIFSGNPSWNRVDVISNATHQMVKSIPVMRPSGVDISVDHSQVWVATQSQQVYSINTASLAATRYLLPGYTPFSGVTDKTWRGQQIFALADGTVLIALTPGSTASSSLYAMTWDPQSNTLNGILPPTGGQFPASWEDILKTGDGNESTRLGRTPQANRSGMT